MIIIDSLQGTLTIILITGIGYYLSYKGWFNGDTQKLISKIVVNVSLPLYMISNLMGSYNKEKLFHLSRGLLIPFLTMVFGYLLAMLITKLIKIPSNRGGIVCSMFALSNSIFVGLPVNLALFGKESIPYVLLYYIANTILFWTIGVYGIARDGGKNSNVIINLETLKRIFSPPLLGFITAVILILFEMNLPKSIMDTCLYVGNLTTPLSLIFIGIVIQSVNFKEIKFDKGMIFVLVGKFLLAPLIVIGLCFGFTLPLLMKKVFVIQAAMPAMTQTSIIAETYCADYEYAAIVTVATTIASMIFIPLYMIILQSIWA